MWSRESKYNHLIDFNGSTRIYNALTKASINVMKDFDMQQLLKINDDETISTLKRIGMVVDELPDELETLNYLFQKNFFGGEPLLFSKHIFDYFEYIEKKLPNVSYFSSIVTNGALLDAEIVHKLIDYKCRSIQITIDGWKEVHDRNRIFKNGKESYDLLIKNINQTIPMLSEDCNIIQFEDQLE